MADHAPTPWVTGDTDHGGNPAYVFRMFGECIADCEFSSSTRINAANAAFIVKAVNNHKALVALAKAYEQWEADIILENKCWTGQNVRLTDELYDRMIQLQTQRNLVLSGVGTSQVSGSDHG